MQEEGCTTLAKMRRRKNRLKFSSTQQLHRAKMKRQMGRVTLCDIKVTACAIVFHTIVENKNVEIETNTFCTSEGGYIVAATAIICTNVTKQYKKFDLHLDDIAPGG